MRAAPLVALAFVACGASPEVPKASVAPVASAKVEAAPATSASAAPVVTQAEITLGPNVDAFNTRAKVAPEPFRVADLPLANLPEPLPPASAPATAPTGDEAAEVTLDWPKVQGQRNTFIGDARTTVRADVKMNAIGRLRIGFSENAIGDAAGAGTGGVFVTCGGGDITAHRPLPARWETLEAAAGGAVKYTVGNGWFDAAQCKIILVGRASVVARPLASGALFAFRQTCAACATGEWLVVLAPRAVKMAATGIGGDAVTQLGPFSRVVLPLRRGGGGSMMGRIGQGILKEWSQVLGVKPPMDGDLLVGVELTQAVSDAEPVAIAYLGVPVPGPGGR